MKRPAIKFLPNRVQISVAGVNPCIQIYNKIILYTLTFKMPQLVLGARNNRQAIFGCGHCPKLSVQVAVPRT